MRTRSVKWISITLIALLLWLPLQSIAVFAQALTEEELSELDGSEILIDDLELEGAALNPEAAAYGSLEPVEVEGQTFENALRFTTNVQPQGTYLFQYVMPIEGKIEQDDVLLASFYARTISSTHETAEGQLAVVMEKTQTWDKSINETIAIPSQWKKFLIPIKAALLMPAGEFPANNAQLTLRLGFKPQVVEIADLQLINYMKAITFDQLPSTPVTYEGMEEDAPWRAEADERIEQYRKGDFAITVIDEDGKPVEGADVHLKMKNHEFKFGTAVNSALALGTDANSEMYRTKLKENFNSVVMENDMKWSWWEGNRARTVQLYNWLGENGFAVRGHALLWDGASRMPADIGELLNDREALDKRIKDHFHELAGYFRGRLFDWDVLNEPVLNKMIRGVYGDEIAADWFKLAKEADPDAKLYLNETQILGVDAPVIDNLSDILQTLKDNEAPIDGIGIQAHFGSTPVAPMDFYDQLTHFTQYADEIAITEFDMNSPRQDVQAMFTRDILIATFSHPNVQSFTMWGFWDGAHWQNNAPLFRSDWSLKPSGEEWRKLIYETWWTDSQGITNASGVYEDRGFYGDYDIIIDYEGVSQTIERSLYKNSDIRVTIVLGQEEDTSEPFIPLPILLQNAEITSPVWPYGSVFGASEASATAVTLSWPDAHDNVAVDGYRIYENGSLLREVDAAITDFDVTGLKPGTSYTYTVEAVDAQGNRSVPSEPLAITTLSDADADATAPGWSKGSFITVSGLREDGAILNWPAGVDNGVVGGYRIYVNGRIVHETTARSYELTDLMEQTSYTVRVESKDANGNLSLGGPIVTFKTLGAADHSAPVWVDASLTPSDVEADSVKVSWSGARDAGGVTAYRLFDGVKELVTLPSSVDFYQINGLTENRTYTFRVEAADHAGNWTTNGPAATVSTAVTQDAVLPTWPKSRTLHYSALTDRTVSLNWTTATDNIAVAAYRIYQDDTVLAEVDGNSFHYNADDLEAGQTYAFRVEAGDAAGNWTSTGPAVTVHTSSGVVRNHTTLYPSDDAFIQAPAVFGGDGTTNNIAYLRYKNAAGASATEQNKNTGNNRRAYLKFPLDTVTGSVYEATLNLYVYAVQTPNLDIGMDLYAAGDSWSETTVNWKNKPVDGSLLGSATVRNAGYWVSIPVTDYVQSELNGDGIVTFKLTDDRWLDQNVDIHSKEATGTNAALKPYLSVGTDEIPADASAPEWDAATLNVSDVKPNRVKLAWSAATDDAGVNGYKIYRDGTAIDTLPADVRSYEATGLTANTSYSFKVEALDAVHETTTGPAAQATTAATDTVAPSWPDGAAVQAVCVTRTGVMLEWTPAEDQYGIEAYAIYNGGVKINEVAGDVHGYEVTGLQPGTAYSFSVKAQDGTGNAASSAAIPVTTLAADDSVPVWGEDDELTASIVTTSGVWLHWPHATDDTAVTNYRIYKGDTIIGEAGAQADSYFASGLSSDMSYTFHVRALDEAGNLSDPLSAETVKTLQQDMITPQWPTGSRINAVLETGAVHVAWDAAVDNIAVKHYQLYRDGVPIALIDGGFTSYSDMAGDPDAVYKVEAVDLVGNWTVFGPSTTDPIIPVPQDTMPPGWPIGSRLLASAVSQTSIRLTWDAAIDQIGVTGYKLFINGSEAATPPGTGWTVTDLAPGTDYDFKVEAVDEAGNESVNGPSVRARTKTAGNNTLPPVQETEEQPFITASDGKVSILFPDSFVTPGSGPIILSLEGTILAEAFGKTATDASGKNVISVKLPPAPDTTSYGLQIPASYLTSSGSNRVIELITDWGTLTLPGHMLANNAAAKAAAFVTVSISRAQLPADTELSGKVGLVLELSVSSQGSELLYDNKEAPIEVRIPYQATDLERRHSQHLSVWYVGDDGGVRGVPSGRYNQATGEIRFTTDHFSKYAVVYNDKTFTDLAAVPWAREAVEALAARGVVRGVSENAYNPVASITRADFLKMLVDTLELSADVKSSSFGDVKDTDYFYEAVEVAHSFGITSGKGGGLFQPRAPITRQEMFTLIARALPLAGKSLPVASPEQQLAPFKDRSAIAPYAESAIAAMVKEGLVQGSAAQLNPTSQSNRAEAAVLMYRLLSYIFD